VHVDSNRKAGVSKLLKIKLKRRGEERGGAWWSKNSGIDGMSVVSKE
jgi:hypothetical protein